MKKMFRDIVREPPGAGGLSLFLETKAAEAQVKIEQVIVTNISSSTEQIRVGIQISEPFEQIPIRDWMDVKKDIPLSITTPIYLERGEKIYANFKGIESFSSLRLQVHGEYI
ncbi:MAG: hypothetical protein ACYDHX_04040 [Methanothrix sp.]